MLGFTLELKEMNLTCAYFFFLANVFCYIQTYYNYSLK